MNNEMNINNMLFNDTNMLNEMILNNKEQVNNNSNLLGSYEGYIRGNLFNNLYNQYENYQLVRLIPNNEQAELLLNVNQATFAAHDIRLYLDINPDDRNMINLFNKYQKQASDAIGEYERRFGPLLSFSPSEENIFSWQAYSFPWEMEEN